MKKVLFDVNVILDVLMGREPFVNASGAAWAAVEHGKAVGLVAGHALTTIHYLVQKDRGAAKARAIITAILKVFAVAAVDGPVLREALDLPCPDLENAVSASAARFGGCDYVITRDLKGFRGSPVKCLTPEEFLALAGVDNNGA